MNYILDTIELAGQSVNLYIFDDGEKLVRVDDLDDLGFDVGTINPIMTQDGYDYVRPDDYDSAYYEVACFKSGLWE